MTNRELDAVFPLIESGILEMKNLVEFCSLLTGRKRVVRIVIPCFMKDEVSSYLVYNFPHMTVASSEFHLRTVRSESNVDHFQIKVTGDVMPEDSCVIWIGYSDGVEQASMFEMSEDPSLAFVYGYPECCRNGYQEILLGKKWFDRFFADRPTYQVMPMLMNRFSSLSDPFLGYHWDYFPCSSTCRETHQINTENRKDLQEFEFSDLTKIIDSHSRAAIFHVDGSFWYHRISDEGAPNVSAFLFGERFDQRKLTKVEIDAFNVRFYLDDQIFDTESGKSQVIIFE